MDRFQASARNPNRTQGGSRRRIIRQAHPRGNHKGGQIQFGHDGMLYVGFGDGGGGGDPDRNGAEALRSPGQAAAHRPQARAAATACRATTRSPAAAGAAGEVFAYGLRNPYRFSFDRRTGDLALADVGQDEVEEVDFVPAAEGKRRPRGGVNFGWSAFEGRRRYLGRRGRRPGPPPARDPAARTPQGSCSITGGYVIRDPAHGPLPRPLRLRRLLRLAAAGGAAAQRPRARRPSRSALRVSSLVSFGEDGRGRVHAHVAERRGLPPGAA